ncbi:unnamed protein product [Cunninghamella blakesleeana]
MEDKRQKENIPPLRFQKIITSPPTSTERHRDIDITTTSPTSNRNRFIPQTFTTSATHRRAEPTRTTRPTIGGKTISSSMISKINSTSINNNNSNNINNNTTTSNINSDNNDNNSNNSNNNNNNNNNSTMDENTAIDNNKNINNSNNNSNVNNNNNNNNQHKYNEQKMSTEQLKMLSRRIDPSLPVSPHGSPCKPALPSIFTNKEKSPKRSSSNLFNKNISLSKTYSCQEPHSYSLYQTCIDLWPTEPTLGDFSSDNIKSLTDLLKVRLSQAKYRILAQLEDEEKKELQGKKYQKMYPSITPVASSLLRDDIDYSTWPTFEKHAIELSPKRSNVYTCVSGNGKNLFRHRDSYLQRHRQQQQQRQLLQLQQQRKKCLSHSIDDLGKYSTVSFPPPLPSSSLHPQKKDLKRKRRSKSKSMLPSSPSSSATSSSTKDARSQRENEARLQASQVQPVVLEDGSQSFVCTSCDKKYKTRNGLAYHLSRCANQNINDTQTSASSNTTLSQEVKIEHDQEITNVNKSSQENSQSTTTAVQDDSRASIVQCICDHPNDDNGMMVQCDECQSWLHVGCVGMADAVLDDIYNCPRCIDRLMKKPKISSNTNTSPETSTTVTDNTTNPVLVTTQNDLTTLNNNALLLQQLNETEKSLNFPPLSSIPPSSPSSNIKSTQQQSAVWDDFEILDNSNSSNNTTTTDHKSNTPNINNENNNNSNINNMWGLSADIPSLLYSDATMMTSTLDDDIPSYLMDLPSSELSPHDLQPTDWFQFANFDDDFCEF